MEKNKMIDAFPLQWPAGWPRTKKPRSAQFGNHSIHYAVDMMVGELKRLGAKKIVLNSDLKLRNDGLPYSNQKTDDKGIAVYFELNDNSQCFPCDKWNKVEHNIWAIYKSIQSLRGLERWGAKEMVSAAFTGFKALPFHSGGPSTTEVRYFDDCVDVADVQVRYRELAKELHPDAGGDGQEFAEMHAQYRVYLERGD